MIVTVNGDHTYEWQSENGKYWKKCQVCGDETAKKDIPTITIDGADAVCVTQDYKFSLLCRRVQPMPSTVMSLKRKATWGLAIIENNELFGIVSMEWYD
ncbi:MAG: hypothetical protein V8S08_06310 [Lachnoclostridium sp.]